MQDYQAGRLCPGEAAVHGLLMAVLLVAQRQPSFQADALMINAFALYAGVHRRLRPEAGAAGAEQSQAQGRGAPCVAADLAQAHGLTLSRASVLFRASLPGSFCSAVRHKVRACSCLPWAHSTSPRCIAISVSWRSA